MIHLQISEEACQDLNEGFLFYEARKIRRASLSVRSLNTAEATAILAGFL